jgi:hypothetical protein
VVAPVAAVEMVAVATNTARTIAVTRSATVRRLGEAMLGSAAREAIAPACQTAPSHVRSRPIRFGNKTDQRVSATKDDLNYES